MIINTLQSKIKPNEKYGIVFEESGKLIVSCPTYDDFGEFINDYHKIKRFSEANGLSRVSPIVIGEHGNWSIRKDLLNESNPDKK